MLTKNNYIVKIYGLIILTNFFITFIGKAQDQKILAPYNQKIPGSEIKIEMVPIPGGTFMMGSPEDESLRNEDEGPRIKVEIAPFWMGKYEITWDQYEEFLDKNKIRPSISADVPTNPEVDAISRPSPPYEDPSFGMGKTGGYPAVSMTQYAALTFCKWLSTVTGEFYRLPTEAEWEYACRAGTHDAYSFGNEVDKLDDYAWHYANSDGKYKKVGLKKPNPWGLYDMHGNVAEWTLDQYDPDFYESVDGYIIKNPLS